MSFLASGARFLGRQAAEWATKRHIKSDEGLFDEVSQLLALLA